MSNFLNFELLSYFCCQSHSQTPRPTTNLFKCDVMISHSSFGKSKETECWQASNGNWEQICRALACFAYLKTYLLGLWVIEQAECLWVSIEHPLNDIEYTCMSLSEYWTVHEYHWVHMNAFEWVWTTPEHHWVHMNAIEWVWTLLECDWVHMSIFE